MCGDYNINVLINTVLILYNTMQARVKICIIFLFLYFFITYYPCSVS